MDRNLMIFSSLHTEKIIALVRGIMLSLHSIKNPGSLPGTGENRKHGKINLLSLLSGSCPKTRWTVKGRS